MKSFYYILLFFFVFTNSAYASSGEDDFNLAQEYFAKSDYAKAKAYYDKISKDENFSDRIYENYRTCLIKLKEYKTADKFFKQRLKANPDNPQVIVDQALNYYFQDDEKAFNNIISKEQAQREKNLLATREFVQALIHRDLNTQAIDCMKNAKKAFNNNSLFALELANLYLTKGDKDQFIANLLVYAKAEPAQLDYVQNLLQSQLTLDDYEKLETQLYPLLSDKSTVVYSELMVWMYVQKKDFYNAYVQLRAIDKSTYNRGKRLLELGALAQDNMDLENAITIFTYVQTTYPTEYNGYLAEKLKIGAKRQKIESTYPVDTSLIRSIVSDYTNLLTKSRRIDDQIDIKRQIARMEAFYLGDYQKAIANLQSLIQNPRINLNLKSACKLELGDIYILINEPWNAALLYYQVEVDFETATIGHDAKLRNAKLSYFKGEFELAQAHLDIIKEATTREIANDAMALSLLIKDNLALDTSDAALKIYALAELYQFQGNVGQAIVYLDSLIHTFPQHTLLDEDYLKKGQIMLAKGKYEEAIANFKTVINTYSNDILADDAMYALAFTYETYLNNPEQAKQVYKQIMIDYPGSVFVVDARKRYRLLRGDKI